jgi:hypothetical protein
MSGKDNPILDPKLGNKPLDLGSKWAIADEEEPGSRFETTELRRDLGEKRVVLLFKEAASMADDEGVSWQAKLIANGIAVDLSLERAKVNRIV